MSSRTGGGLSLDAHCRAERISFGRLHGFALTAYPKLVLAACPSSGGVRSLVACGALDRWRRRSRSPLVVAMPCTRPCRRSRADPRPPDPPPSADLPVFCTGTSAPSSWTPVTGHIASPRSD
jgi:hypothetical protein